MERITSVERFREFGLNEFTFAHEPDQWGCSARVQGMVFDNAGFWPPEREWPGELCVIFTKVDDDDYAHDVACVNLLELCAWVMGAQHA